jgi:glycosyltransferase involved in cell wall biosynthesis
LTGDRLRVLVVEPYAELGGAEEWLLRLLDATDELEPRALLLKEGPFRAELERRGIPVELHAVGRNPWNIPAPVAWLARRLRADRPDVVLGNITKAQLVAGPAAGIARVPSVWIKHDHGYDRLLARPLGRLSTRVIGTVEEVVEPVGRDDAVVILPPRPAREPAPRTEARAHLETLGVPLDDAPTLVMATRLVPFKGVDDAVLALARPEAEAWKLVVFGGDDHAAPGETERLRALARDAGVAERVHFAGRVPEIAHWLAAFDALAVLTKAGGRRAPSMEGFGMSAFEAMRASVPVVAVSGGAVVRRLDGRAGIGVPPGDPAAVAAALGRLTDPAARDSAGAAAREIVADHPTDRDCARELVRVLRDAAATRQRRASTSS